MATTLRNLWSDESGQGLAETALLMALIAMVSLAALTAFGGTVNTKLTNNSTALN